MIPGTDQEGTKPNPQAWCGVEDADCYESVEHALLAKGNFGEECCAECVEEINSILSQ